MNRCGCSNTEIGVVMVLAQVQMPLMVLPILTVLSKMDPNLADASRVLGAGEWRTFWKVTLPLSLPGIIAGCILTYSASITAFVTQSLIGGARLIYMPLHIYQQAVGANNWPFAARHLDHFHDRGDRGRRGAQRVCPSE